MTPVTDAKLTLTSRVFHKHSQLAVLALLPTLLPTAYVVREEVIFSVCLSVHTRGGGYLPSGWWGGGYLLRSGQGGEYLLKSGWWGGGVPTLRSGQGGYLPSQVWTGGVPTFRMGGYLPSQVVGGT